MNLLDLLYEGQFPIFHTPIKISRNEEIAARYREGYTMAEIADQFGIAEQRVHQILHGKRK